MKDQGPSMNQPLAPEEYQDISEELVHLLKHAREGIQQEVNRSVLYPPIEDLVVLVLNGASPLASLIPQLQGLDARTIAAKLMNRAGMIRGLTNIYPILAEAMTHPVACGHLEYVASTKNGALLLCTTCDLGLKPTAAAKA